MKRILILGLVGVLSMGGLASCSKDDKNTASDVKAANTQFCTDLTAYGSAVSSLSALDPAVATKSDYASAADGVKSSRETLVSSAKDLSDSQWTNLQAQTDELKGQLKDAPDDQAVGSILTASRVQAAKVIASIAVVNTAVCPKSAAVTTTTSAAKATKTVVVLLQEDPQASTLVKFVTAAGLGATLSGPGPFTIMAPTNEAFAAVPAATVESLQADPTGALADVLKLHVIPGAVDSAAATAAVGTCVDTLGGKVLISKDAAGNLLFGGAKILRVDIKGSNGVVHFIDGVVTAASTDCPTS